MTLMVRFSSQEGGHPKHNRRAAVWCFALLGLAWWLSSVGLGPLVCPWAMLCSRRSSAIPVAEGALANQEGPLHPLQPLEETRLPPTCFRLLNLPHTSLL
jgi:hypothetical protein